MSESGAVPEAVQPPAPVETGHARVDAALAALAELEGVPVDAHAGVFEGVHEALRTTLSALDEPGPGGPRPTPQPAPQPNHRPYDPNRRS
ncbi:hypothetical protein [Streptacidiphilus sp. EB129]|jgi:hypothetical protein|uniref:hypothetical protein n=1 Tax=Streptacidiphilus sp. EB129 TaxID=3156262 RepID=UPI0035169FA3